MMRSWPLDKFKPKMDPKRGANKWNGKVGKLCFDCGEAATLWVEIDKPIEPGIVFHRYSKLCETCYTLRVLGANEEAR